VSLKILLSFAYTYYLIPINIIFQDVQWNDIDYMIGQNDFTVDPDRFGGLAELIQDIHNVGMRWVPIIDPGISGSEKPGTNLPPVQ